MAKKIAESPSDETLKAAVEAILNPKQESDHRWGVRTTWCSKTSEEISKHVDDLISQIVSLPGGPNPPKPLERLLLELEATECTEMLRRRPSL